MKPSIYKLNHGVYLAVLESRQITRGSIEGLASALVQLGISADHLLLGDWREGAELLSSSEQKELRIAMTTMSGVPAPALALNASLASDHAGYI